MDLFINGVTVIVVMHTVTITMSKHTKVNTHTFSERSMVACYTTLTVKVE